MADNQEVTPAVAVVEIPLTIIRHDFQLAAVHGGYHTTLGSNGWRLLHRHFANYERNSRRLTKLSHPDNVFRQVYEREVSADQPLLEGLFVDEHNIAGERFKNFVLFGVQPGEYRGIGELTLALYNQVAIEKQLVSVDT